MKTCPYCAEAVQDAAIVCRHCQRDITAPPSYARTEAAKRGRRSLWLALGALCGVAVLGWLITTGMAENARRADVERWHDDCDAVMRERPTTAELQRLRESCAARRDALRAE